MIADRQGEILRDPPDEYRHCWPGVSQYEISFQGGRTNQKSKDANQPLDLSHPGRTTRHPRTTGSLPNIPQHSTGRMDTVPIVCISDDKKRREIDHSREKQPNALLAVLEAWSPCLGEKMHMSFPPTHSLKLQWFPRDASCALDYPTAHSDTSGSALSKSAGE